MTDVPLATAAEAPLAGMSRPWLAVLGCRTFLACRAVLCAGAALLISAPATAARSALNPDDFYRVQSLSDPRVSPDGQWVAYVVATNDRETDEARSAIWMVSWDGKQRVALTAPEEDIAKPRWSPDGRYLAFIAKAGGSDRRQLMLLDRRGGSARALTGAGAGTVNDYAWSPDGERVVLVADRGDESADKAPKPIVIDARHFKQDEDGYLSADRKQHLQLLEVASKHLEPLTADPAFNDESPAWSPDGLRIAFSRSQELGADPDGRADIDVIDAHTGGPQPGSPPAGGSPSGGEGAGGPPARGQVRTLIRPFAPNKQRLAWTPDSTALVFLQGKEPKLNAYMQDRLFLVPASGGNARPLAERLDRAVTSYAFSADSSAVLVSVEDVGTKYPARIPLIGGAAARETAAGPYVISGLSTAAGHTALLKSSDGAFDEVYALEDGHFRQLTAHNEEFLAERELGAVEDVRFKSKDGTEVHGLLVKPASYQAGRRYPLVLWIHGGPNEQVEHSLSLDGYEFEPQMFAAQGFLVLRVNYRGSAGRGAAYAEAILADWGHKEVEDLLAGVDALVARGVADPHRLAIGGWSYGGILTDYTIAADGRFKAAISGAGSANQLSTYGSDEYLLQYNNELGPPWKNTALWLKVSYPFFHADRIHTPTLFVGGEKDFNVPIVGSEQMYAALKTLGVPTRLVVYPGEYHVFTRPSFVKDLAERMSQWLGQYLPPTS